MAAGSYTMNVDNAKKLVYMTVGGSFTPEQSQQFINDYQQKISKINAGEYVLEFDCSELDVITKEMIPDVENCLSLYKSSGFKKVEVGIRNSALISMQLKRLAGNVGLPNFEVIQKY